jgi:sentrin-specific protease 7
MLLQTDRDKYERVKKWTKNVDVFDQDYLFVPIHDHAHWSVAIVCQPGELMPEQHCSIEWCHSAG